MREITKLFLSKHKQAEYYLRDKAKENLLKSDKINQYNFIHLATHGFINETNPKLSGILFTKEEKKEIVALLQEDHKKYLQTIQQWNIDRVARLKSQGWRKAQRI